MIEHQTFDFGFVNFFVFFCKFIVLLCKLLMVFVSRFRVFYFLGSLFCCAFRLYQRNGFVEFSLDYGFVYLLIDYFLSHKPPFGTLFAIVYQGFQSVGIDFGDGILHSEVFGCRYLASVLSFLQFQQAFLFLFLVILCCGLGLTAHSRIHVILFHQENIYNVLSVVIGSLSGFGSQQCVTCFRRLGNLERCFGNIQLECTAVRARCPCLLIRFDNHSLQWNFLGLAILVCFHCRLFHDSRTGFVFRALGK